jgi:hypothetical protein
MAVGLRRLHLATLRSELISLAVGWHDDPVTATLSA